MKKRKKTRKLTIKKRLHVAVVMIAGQNTSLRYNGDYSCLIGDTQLEVVQAAMKFRARCEASGKYGPYIIAVGVLDKAVKEFPRYTLKGLP